RPISPTPASPSRDRSSISRAYLRASSGAANSAVEGDHEPLIGAQFDGPLEAFARAIAVRRMKYAGTPVPHSLPSPARVAEIEDDHHPLDAVAALVGKEVARHPDALIVAEAQCRARAAQGEKPAIERKDRPIVPVEPGYIALGKGGIEGQPGIA